MPRSAFSRLAIGALAVVAPLGLVACGDDDDGGSLSGDQQEGVDSMTEILEDLGAEVDADCITDLASQLSDDDAAALAEAGVDGDPELSDEGEALGEQVEDCVTFEE